MQSNIKILLELFVILIFTNITSSQVIITEVDSVNALAYGNSRKLVVSQTGVVSLVFGDKGEIFYTESNDQGLTWLPPINVSLNSAVSEFPALAIDTTGRKHLVWQDNTIPDNPEQLDEKIRIYYNNFVELSEIPERYAIPIGESAGNSLNPSLAIDKKGKLYAAWAADMSLSVGWEINYSEGTLIGNGLLGLYDWTLPEIPGTPLGLGASFFPSIDIDGEVLFIAWLEQDPFFQLVNLIRFRDIDGWSEHFDLSFQAIGPFANSVAGIPSIVVGSDSTAHLAFQEILESQNNTFNDVFYLRYQTGDTLIFELGENISKTVSPSSNPVITSDIRKNLYIAWEQQLGSGIDIFAASRDTTGWSEPENISLSGTQSISPQIAVVNNDSLLVVWMEGDEPPFSLVAKKIDALVTSVRDFREHKPALDGFQLFRNYPNPFNAST